MKFMVPTDLTHKTTTVNPIVYKVYFSKNTCGEIERILTNNFCNTTIRPYSRWLKYFYATTKWIQEIYQWLSQLTYGYVDNSISLGNQYQHTCPLGSLTYQLIRDINGEVIVLVTNVRFNPFVFKKTRILMENFRNNKILKISESQLRRLIRESIKKVLNII